MKGLDAKQTISIEKEKMFFIKCDKNIIQKIHLSPINNLVIMDLSLADNFYKWLTNYVDHLKFCYEDKTACIKEHATIILKQGYSFDLNKNILFISKWKDKIGYEAKPTKIDTLEEAFEDFCK